MSITQSLNNALTGLRANARQAELTSSNLSNALTEGYGVRSLDLSSQTVGRASAGVRIDGVTRHYDKGILADRRLADAEVGAHNTKSDGLSELERILGTPNDGAGLAARIVAVETALITASTDPSSDLRLEGVTHALTAMSDSFNTAQDRIQAMREGADRSISAQVGTLNASLTRIEALNVDIQRARATGTEPSGLIDQRQTAIDQISEIVPIRLLDRENGRVAVMTVQGEMLLDGPAPTYEFTAANTIMPQMTLGAGLLGGITRDGVPLAADGYGALAGGSLEASFDMRDTVLTEAQTSLDAIARDVVVRFQDTATDLSRTGTTPGLLTDGRLIFTAANTSGLAGRVALNSLVDPNEGGEVRLIRDGVAAAAGPVGDASQLNRWLDAMSNQRALSIGGPSGNATDHAARLSSKIGLDRLSAEDQSSFATARWSAVREAELAGGVDSDFEMQMLLRVEQAYAANAKVIETVQFMMRELMEL